MEVTRAVRKSEQVEVFICFDKIDTDFVFDLNYFQFQTFRNKSKMSSSCAELIVDSFNILLPDYWIVL